MNHREPEDEIIECRDCGAKFDLTKQNYYDNRCPDCVDDERTKAACMVCNTNFYEEDGVDALLPNRTLGRKERVRVCSTECKHDAEPARGP